MVAKSSGCLGGLLEGCPPAASQVRGLALGLLNEERTPSKQQHGGTFPN